MPFPVILPGYDGLPRYDGHAMALFSRIKRAVWVYDLDRHRLHWGNEAALAVWDAASLAELQARDFQPAAPGTDQRLGNVRSRLLQGERLAETWMVYPRGKPRLLQCHFSGVQMENGGVGMMVEAYDAAEQGDAPQVDASYELRAIEAVRHAPLMISLATDGGHWLMHNPAAEELVCALDLPNIPHFDNFLALFDDPGLAAALRAEAIATGAAHATLRITGEVLRMHDVMLRRLVDPVTGRLSLIVSQQDVTHTYRLEQRLKKALARERAVTETQRQFLLLTSHDFRTPLAIIEGAARRIGRLVTGHAAVEERVVSIRKAVRRMIDAIDTTLASEQMGKGQFDFRPELHDLRPILHQAIETQRLLHPARRFEVDLPALPSLMLDPALVEQAFENILSNAVKYSPVAAPVAIACRVESSCLVMTVRDHGIGVPAAEVAKLFTRFFRASNTGAVRGTGVGLNAVRYVMGLHGGEVAMESEEGRGSTVTLRFPLPAGQ